MVQFSGRLLIVLLAAGATACAARGGTPRPFPGAALPPTAAPELPAEAGSHTPELPAGAGTHRVIAMALGYRGVPYRNGGSDPSGFDCSGFVQYVFKQVGALLPRQAFEQFRIGREIDRDEVQPGDLVFFETVSRGASHVGLAIGGDEFVHAPSARGAVRVEKFSAPYWARRIVEVRRITKP